MKHTTWLLLLATLLFTACSKDDGPLEIRYRNLTGKTLLDLQVASGIVSGTPVKIGDLAPGGLSEYHVFDKKDIFPSPNLTGKTDGGYMISVVNMDDMCEILEAKTSGRIAYDITKSPFTWQVSGIEYVTLWQER